jgi:hypothetical protein
MKKEEMKVCDPNKKGIIYYGTDYQYIYELDKSGLKTPRHRNEQFISVSISGYESKTKIEHPDLKEFARVYSEELKIAEYREGFLTYKNGYINSVTCVEGFGPNPNLYYNSFFGLVDNLCSEKLLTAVLSDEAAEYLVFPDKEKEFEYLSLALHGFIKEIKNDLIIGWIVAEEHINDLKKKMDSGDMKKREIWSIKEFQTFNFDLGQRSRYGFFPSDVNMYLENIKVKNVYFNSSKEHLKNILQEIVPSEINWNNEGDVLENEIKNWWNKNKDKTVWNSKKFRYEYVSSLL